MKMDKEFIDEKTLEMINVVHNGKIIEAFKFIENLISDVQKQEEEFPYEVCKRCDSFVGGKCIGVSVALKCSYLLSKLELKKPKIDTIFIDKWASEISMDSRIFWKDAKKKLISMFEEAGFKIEK